MWVFLFVVKCLEAVLGRELLLVPSTLTRGAECLLIRVREKQAQLFSLIKFGFLKQTAFKRPVHCE